MSTDAFAPVLFPRLDAGADSAQHARSRLRGYADGHAEGFRTGLAEAAAAQRAAAEEQTAREAAAAQEMRSAIDALHAAAQSLQVRERELTAAAQEEVLRCAIELAELILAGELSDAGAAAGIAARRALAVASAEDVREVRLHPDDLRILQDSEHELSSFVLVADDTLDRGDAVAVLEHGRIDARIRAALERARTALTEVGE